jgi:anti-sigma regulatory factor (Ser/Thr protein kinase)
MSTAPFEYRIRVPRDPRAVGVTRASLRAALTAHRVPDLIDRAELLAGELLANALVHTEGEAELRLAWRPDTLRVSVRDTSPVLPAPVAAGDDAEGGRGLHLVALLADRWGRCPLREGAAKEIWCEVTSEPRGLQATGVASSASPEATGACAGSAWWRSSTQYSAAETARPRSQEMSAPPRRSTIGPV